MALWQIITSRGLHEQFIHCETLRYNSTLIPEDIGKIIQTKVFTHFIWYVRKTIVYISVLKTGTDYFS